MSKARFYHSYLSVLRGVTRAMAAVSGTAIFTMMLVICADVILRARGHPVSGSYDIVRMLSVLVIACALPNTTAVKGHVAVELLFDKLPWRLRVILDGINRAVVIVLFGLMAMQNVKYGLRLKASGEVMSTLPLPIYWIPYVIAAACAVVVLVKIYHMLNPGKALIES